VTLQGEVHRTFLSRDGPLETPDEMELSSWEERNESEKGGSSGSGATIVDGRNPAGREGKRWAEQVKSTSRIGKRSDRFSNRGKELTGRASGGTTVNFPNYKALGV
jgi:hypothetical protein